MKHVDACLYCRMPLSKRHEHDHMPIPARFGGDLVHCVCINCHDLKDRTPLDSWTPGQSLEALNSLWGRAEPLERIVLAKIFAMVSEVWAQIDAEAPYGSTPAEAAVLQCVKELRAAGLSMHQIRAELCDRGLLAESDRHTMNSKETRS